jgi:drug/metabolite transporter (DMT)-like permease
MFLVVLLYAVLASTFIFAKKAVMLANPCFLVGVRMLIAGLLLLGYFWIFNRQHLVIKKADWWLFFKVSLFHIYIAFIFDLWSLQYITALKSTLIFSTTPFIAAILSYLLLREGLSVRKVIGIVIGIGGLIPVILSQACGQESSIKLMHVSLPEVVLFMAVISGSYAWFLVKRLMDRGYSFGVINGTAMLVGGIMSMFTAGIFEGFGNPVRDVYPFIGWLMLLILSANIIFYNLYGYLLQRYSITFITFAGWLCPFFATLYEWLFMGGKITWFYVLSMVLITIGLYIFYQDELKKKNIYANKPIQS